MAQCAQSGCCLNIERLDITHLLYLVRLEKEYSDFILQDTYDTHFSRLGHPNYYYGLIRDMHCDAAGYFILEGLTEDTITLKRIVIEQPSHGLGKRVLQQILDLVKETWSPREIFLDVFIDNLRAYYTYRKVGFVPVEVTMRETSSGAYRDLILMQYQPHLHDKA